MRHIIWVALSLGSISMGALTACTADDEIPTPPVRDGSGGSSQGTGGSLVDASAGKGGSSGSAGRAGSAGTGGSSGYAGSSGAAGAGQDMDAGPDVFDGFVCEPETNQQFCARQQKNCDNVSGVTNCGTSSTITCGTCLGPQTCGGGGTANVCFPINRAVPGGTITASVATDTKPTTEGRQNVFDNDAHTKWYVNVAATPWIAYQFPGGATYAITTYTVSSANDMPTRDPKSWRLEATNDPNLANWTVLDTRTDELFANRYQTNTYAFANTTAYAAYRFFVTANNGSATQFQMSELQLFDIPVSTPEAGAPDASDAATPTDGAEDATSTSDVVVSDVPGQ